MSCHFFTQLGCRLQSASGRSVQLTRNMRTSCCLSKGKDLDIRKNRLPTSPEDKKSKIKDPDRGTFMNWLKKNTGQDRKPKNMPSDPDKLDAIDRMAITSSNVDYDYEIVSLVASYYNTKSKDWEHFNQVIEAYKKPDKSGMRVGQVEFIYGSLKRLKDFGLHKDVKAYNALLDVFPKGKMIPENIVQFGFMHYAKQQFCAIDLLEEMEWNQVLPDQQTIDLVLSIFSIYSQVFDKLGTMIYWTTKARYNDPYPLPNVLPYDPKELATISFRRMCIDPTTDISIYSTEGVPDAIDKTWIVSAMSPVQQKLINKLNEPLFIDGPHIMWLKDHMTSYFILKTAAPKEFKENEEDLEDMRDLPLYAHGGLSKKQHIEKMEAIHKSPEGTICGLVATGTSSRDSLLSYIRILQHHLPKLRDLNVIFTQRAPEYALSPYEEEKNENSKNNDENIKLIVNK